jgi:outer membrane biosynthesis protein TonB
LKLILRSLFLGWIGVVALGALALSGTAGAEPGDKETICHNAGQSGNVVQITVSTNAGTTNPGGGGHLQDKHQEDKDVLVGPGQVGGPGAEVFKDGADCAKKAAPPQAPQQPEKPQAPTRQPDVKPQAPAPRQPDMKQQAPPAQQVAPQQVAPQQVAPRQVVPPQAGSGGLLEGNATSSGEGVLPWLSLLGGSLLILGGGVLARRSL